MRDSAPIGPFGRPGTWLRCCLHAHTTESDGMLSPAMLRRYFVLGGYDVLAITDHDRLTPLPSEPDHTPEMYGRDILLIQGTELSLRAPVSGGPLHVVAVGIAVMPEVSASSSFVEAVTAIQAQGGVAILAHPWWSGLLPEELPVEALAQLAALEVFNSGCEVEQGRGNSGQYWDALLSKGIRVNAVASDDHHMPGFDAFRSWTVVRAAERTPEGVVTALRDGAFYCSCGPEIRDIRRDANGGITVETSPVQSISALAQPPIGTRLNAGAHGLAVWGQTPLAAGGWREGTLDGDLLTSAHFPHFPGVRYVRVEAVDALGRRAWSNPIWLEQD